MKQLRKKEIKMTSSQIALAMAVLTFISKAIGFVRELFLANYYGAGTIIDAYVMAQDIPDTLIAAFIQFVGVAYLPIFSEIYEKNGKKEGNRFTNQIYTMLLLISLLVLLICELFSKQLISIFAPGFSIGTANLSVFYLRIASILLLGNIAITIYEPFLRYKGHFLLPIVLGFSQSLFIIIFTLISIKTTHYLLIVGVVLGYLVRGLVLHIYAAKEDYKFSLDFDFSKSAKRVILFSLPIIVSSFAGRFNSFIDKMLASKFEEGTVASLNYANLIVTMIGAFSYGIIATMVYPKFNQYVASKKNSELNVIVNKGWRATLISTIPLAIGSIVFSTQIIRIIYERGSFGTYATEMTSNAFMYYSVGLPFLGIVLLISQLFYSLHDTKSAVNCSLIAVAINIILNFILSKFIGPGGLALATSVSSIANAILLYYSLKRKYNSIVIENVSRDFFKIVGLSIVSVGASYLLYLCTNNFFGNQILFSTGIAVLVAVTVYFLLLKMFGFKEVNYIYSLFENKIGGKK